MTIKATAVLMYHAVADAAASGADPHYTVTRARFRAQLDALTRAGFALCSVQDLLQAGTGDARRVALTFDDGHASNLDAAADIVARAGHADFFVNPHTVGTPGYLGWGELRDMAASGMSIQSHGYHHRYLDELAPTDVEYELKASKQAIEDKLGLPVTLYAPAGGRMPSRFLSVAQRLGYTVVCSSRPGRWNGRAREIPRLAVLSSTTDVRLLRWAHGDRHELVAQQLRYRTLRVLKRALGNRGYEALRARLLGGADGT